MGIILIFIICVSEKVVDIQFTNVAPKIDGIIEPEWSKADSAYDFIQQIPYERTEPSEKTVAYVLQDDRNLYVAIRCYARERGPAACLTGNEDWIMLAIDPFGSKTTAYYFRVHASGIYDDGWILDDGFNKDNSWDGVWNRAVGRYDDRYEVEIKIPFKSIRYKKGLTEWGMQFKRYILHNQEIDYWTEITELEEDKVSKFGILRGIDPRATGYYFEVYPEAYLRHDRFINEEDRLKPSASLNLKWDVTPQMTLNATAFPDFAQIESDPFELNLTQYPTHLKERRPFFLEGKDIFRMSDLGAGRSFFRPLEIFYSRRIGRLIGDNTVPIIAGMKLADKSEDLNIGILGAYTDSLRYMESDTTVVTEPRRWFGVARIKQRFFKNSDIGLLFSSTMVDENEYNGAVGIDGVYRTGPNQFIIQGAVSDRNGKRGFAGKAGCFSFYKNFLTVGSLEASTDSFDVGDIGYLPWPGYKKFLIFSGPFKQYRRGWIRSLFLAPGFVASKLSGEENYSKIIGFEINPNFRNLWGLDLSILIGPYYEADISYTYRSAFLACWGDLFNNDIHFGLNYNYTYNYARDFLADQVSSWFGYSYSFLPQLALSISSNSWFEWDTTSTLISITSLLRPEVELRLNADMKLNIFNEFVVITPKSAIPETELYSNRLGLLFAWNFRPKSWIYIALNDYREEDETGNLAARYRISAVKVKYLIYF